MQTAEAETAAATSVHFRRRYPASQVSCPRARHDVAAALLDIGLSDEGAFAGSVVFSELFTNALLHHPVGPDESVQVGIHGAEDGQEWVGIAVTDSGRGAVKPAKDAAPERVDFGHGLEVVRGLGARLTDVRIPGAYTVTAWVPAHDEQRQRVCQCDCVSMHGADPSACAWLIDARGPQEEGTEDLLAHLCVGCRALVLNAQDENDATLQMSEAQR